MPEWESNISSEGVGSIAEVAPTSMALDQKPLGVMDATRRLRLLSEAYKESRTTCLPPLQRKVSNAKAMRSWSEVDHTVPQITKPVGVLTHGLGLSFHI